MRPYLIIVSLLLFFCAVRVMSQPLSDRVVKALEKSDHSALAATFHKKIDLQIPGYSGNFSQSQASVILQRFFSDHPVTSVRITRNGENSDGSSYAIGELVSSGKKYRLYYVTRDISGEEKVMVFKVMVE